MKKCVHCSTEKNLSEFGMSKTNNDGLKSWCKKCCIDYRREWAKTHPEKIKKFRKEDYDKHAEHYKFKAKEWSAQNPVWKKLTDAIWRGNNKEKKSESDKNWRHTPEGKGARYEAHMKRRNNKINSGDKISRAEYAEIISGRCVYCGTDKNIHLDHIVPIASGGADSVSNAAPICKSCNSKKGKKSILSFLSYLRYGY